MKVTRAEVYDIVSIGRSMYTLQKENRDYLNIALGVIVSSALKSVTYIVYSTTYNY